MTNMITRQSSINHSEATGATLLINTIETKENPSQTLQGNQEKISKIPVILDTDIGGDIDDAWALAIILKSPEFDLKMVVTDTGNPTYRGAVTGKYLEASGRTDIPIGLGVYEHDETGPQEPWLGDYQLSDYPGQVYQDGIGAMIDLIRESPEPITLICISPVPNIKAALEREPSIVTNLRIVGMFGSLRYGYKYNKNYWIRKIFNIAGSLRYSYNRNYLMISKENNVRFHTDACRQMFDEFHDITITPLDTCGIVRLTGKNYKKIHDCNCPLIKALIESYYSWSESVEWTQEYPKIESSKLFDTVAVYLALSEEYLEIENLGIQITDEGYTLIDSQKKAIRCATKWKNLPAFEDWVVDRLTSEVCSPRPYQQSEKKLAKL